MATKEIPEHHQWANNLKPGDTVFENERFRYGLSKTTVVKVTKASIIVGKNNTAYPRSSLSRRIDAWTHYHLEEATPERMEKYRLQEARAKIKSLAHDIYNTKTKRSTIEIMTIEELLVLKGAMETVCGLLDEAEKRGTK
jgi:cobalamin biosynthesis protein CbiD